MMNKTLTAFIVSFGFVWAAHADTTPYAGQDARAIATLSPSDVDDLLAGRGWGFAKAAELNGYPGPTHVLELAEELELSAAQRRQIQAIFDAMNTQARVLGAQMVAAEAALNASFKDGAINRDALADLVASSAEIESDLRALHLAAHLETKPVLSRHQIMIYNTARGYGDTAGGHDGGHGHD